MSYDLTIDVPESSLFPLPIDIPYRFRPGFPYLGSLEIKCFITFGPKIEVADLLYRERSSASGTVSGRMTGTIIGDPNPSSIFWNSAVVRPSPGHFDVAFIDAYGLSNFAIPYSVAADYELRVKFDSGSYVDPAGDPQKTGKLLFNFPPYWGFVGDGEEPEVGTPPTTGVSTDNPYGPVTPSIPLVGVPDAADPPCLTPSFVQPAPPISTPCASVSNGSTTQGTFTKLS